MEHRPASARCSGAGASLLACSCASDVFGWPRSDTESRTAPAAVRRARGSAVRWPGSTAVPAGARAVHGEGATGSGGASRSRASHAPAGTTTTTTTTTTRATRTTRARKRCRRAAASERGEGAAGRAGAAEGAVESGRCSRGCSPGARRRRRRRAARRPQLAAPRFAREALRAQRAARRRQPGPPRSPRGCSSRGPTARSTRASASSPPSARSRRATRCSATSRSRRAASPPSAAQPGGASSSSGAAATEPAAPRRQPASARRRRRRPSDHSSVGQWSATREHPRLAPIRGASASSGRSRVGERQAASRRRSGALTRGRYARLNSASSSVAAQGRPARIATRCARAGSATAATAAPARCGARPGEVIDPQFLAAPVFRRAPARRPPRPLSSSSVRLRRTGCTRACSGRRARARRSRRRRDAPRRRVATSARAQPQLQPRVQAPRRSFSGSRAARCAIDLVASGDASRT